MQTMLKKVYFLIAFILLITTAGLSLAASFAPPQPKLKIIPEVWDLGKIKPSSSYSLSYKVYNPGRAALKINNVRSSCGCTDVKISSKEILPNEYATLEATYRSGSIAGIVEKSIFLETNAPGQGNVAIKIKAEILPK